MLSEMMCRRKEEEVEEVEEEGKEALHREAGGRRRRGWAKACRGRQQGRRKGGGGARWPRARSHPHHPHLHHHHHHQPRPQNPGGSLRPVNVKGNRARGMRAPRNTNQFLMQEKYQMLHLRSDSVGGDSGSDSDLELTDMDSYLGVLENARGALLDGLAPPPAGPYLRPQEDSMPYFPSEDDLLQSHNFMHRDFVEFCDILSP